MGKILKKHIRILVFIITIIFSASAAACTGHGGEDKGQAVSSIGHNTDGGDTIQNEIEPTAAIIDAAAGEEEPTAAVTDVLTGEVSPTTAAVDTPAEDVIGRNSEDINKVSDHQIKDENGITHLEFYERFDAYNKDWDYFKGFVLSEIRIDGDLFYQLLCEVNDVRIIVDKTQENAVIYHNGKKMDYKMMYLMSWSSSYATVELLDITGDGEEELIICHGCGGTGVFEGSCDVIDLKAMKEYKINDYIYDLSTRVVVEPLEITEDYLICKVTDSNGNVCYGKADAVYENLSDYSYQSGSYNPYYVIWVDYDDKCLGVSTGICLDDLYNCCYLGDVCSHMIFNPDTQVFELSDEYSVDIDEVE